MHKACAESTEQVFFTEILESFNNEYYENLLSSTTLIKSLIQA